MNKGMPLFHWTGWFDKSTKDVCSGIQPQSQNDDKAEYNSDMSFPLDRPFESKADNNEKKKAYMTYIISDR